MSRLGRLNFDESFACLAVAQMLINIGPSVPLPDRRCRASDTLKVDGVGPQRFHLRLAPERLTRWLFEMTANRSAVPRALLSCRRVVVAVVVGEVVVEGEFGGVDRSSDYCRMNNRHRHCDCSVRRRRRSRRGCDRSDGWGRDRKGRRHVVVVVSSGDIAVTR